MRLALTLVLLGGCYLKPTWSTPLRSPEGVDVSLLGADCEDHSGVEGDPVSRDLGVKVKIDNPTARRLRLREDQIRLVIGGDSAGVVGAAETMVPPRSSAIVKLSFVHHAMCNPEREFVIAWNHAFSLEDQPMGLASLAFKP